MTDIKDTVAPLRVTVRIPKSSGPETPDARTAATDRGRHSHRLRPIEGVDAERTTENEAIRVLIAYADSFARTGLHSLLDAERDIAVVGGAADGAEAIAMARQFEPDVLLVDISLPVIDGVEVTRQLAVEGGTRARVLVLSSSEQDDEVLSSLRAGASGFLLNDIEPAELSRAVRTAAAGDAVLSPRVARQVIHELASRPDPRLPAPSQLEELTPREREVMALVATGLSNEEIAEYLVVTRATAKTHVSRALGKLRVRGRAQLVTLAYESGLVLPKKTAAARSTIVASKLAA
jgi:DNA-binding NarL/FixJ family response regulator